MLTLDEALSLSESVFFCLQSESAEPADSNALTLYSLYFFSFVAIVSAFVALDGLRLVAVLLPFAPQCCHTWLFAFIF